MIILRQNNYSWDEIKKATKSIGTGALIGAGTGALLGKRQLTKKNNSKGFLIRTGIGAAIGAGLGAKSYVSGYKTRKRIEREEPHKKELDEVIKKNFAWALNYLKGLDEKINRENNKLKELNKKLLVKGGNESNRFFYDYISLVELYNNYSHLSDYIANFHVDPDVYLTPNEEVKIVYNEETNQLELVDYLDKLITPIKNKSILRDIVKKYYFDDVLAELDYIFSNPGDTGLDYGEYTLMCRDYKTSEEEYYKDLNIYCDEIRRFIKTL